MISNLKKLWIKRRAAADVVHMFNDEAEDLNKNSERKFKLGGNELRDEEKEIYQHEFEFMAEILADIEVFADNPEIVNVDLEKKSATIKVNKGWKWFAIILVSALFVVAAYQLMFSSNITDPRDYRYITRVGEQKSVNLSDGSVIRMNTNTEIIVTMSNDLRKVILQRGEAYFDIARDERSFNVDLGIRQITVLGTEFNLYRTDRFFTLAIIEGEVALHKSGLADFNSITMLKLVGQKVKEIQPFDLIGLTAGQVIEFNIGSEMIKANYIESLEEKFDWRTGILKFKAVSLGEVIELLNRYSIKSLVLESDSLNKLKVCADVHLDQLESDIMSFDKILPVDIVIKKDQISFNEFKDGSETSNKIFKDCK